MEDVAEADDRFGDVLAVGDFNGDGFDDLAIGVVVGRCRLTVGRGRGHVIYGSIQGLSPIVVPDQL